MAWSGKKWGAGDQWAVERWSGNRWGGSRQLTPRMVPGCMWEYDLYNWSTLFQDKNGTIPVTNYGQPVGLNLDLSGNGHHRFSESAARPTLELSASGKPCLYYPSTSRYMKTNPFAWGSDKVCVIMGVRKLASETQVFIEFSPNVDSYINGFNVATDAGTANSWYYSIGSIAQGQLRCIVTPYQSPITNIVSAYYDRSLSGNDKIIPKINNSTPTQIAYSGAGSNGNYGTYALYFGTRAGVSYFFNGYEFSSCGFNKIPTDPQFAALNRYINNKTGAY